MTTIPNNTHYVFKPIGETTCTCGCQILIGFIDDHALIMHKLPVCETYKRFESPVDYLHHIRMQRTN
jgi:hypothetical protein